MRTQSYSRYYGPGAIGISVGYPRFREGGIPRYLALAPRRDMLRMAYATYRDVFMKSILGRLDPKKVEADLRRMAGDHTPVLLCYEDLRKPGQWCHRTMVAEWFGDHGVDVVETDPMPRNWRELERQHSLL